MSLYLTVLIVSMIFAGWGDAQARLRDGGVARPRGATIGMLMTLVVLSGVSALRWRVGVDYWNYDESFDRYVRELPESASLFGEPGIRLLAWLSNVAGWGSAGMFAFAAIITVGLTVHSTWRWSISFAFSIAVYVLSGGWHESFNGVRQYLAAATIFAGHRHIVNRDLTKWVLVVVTAMLFHVSAIVGLLLFLVPNRRLSFAAQFAILLGSIGALAGTSQLLEIAAGYSENPNVWGGEYALRAVNPLRIAFTCLPLILYWLLRTRERIGSGGDWFYVNMVVIIAGVALAGGGSAYLSRFAIYPDLFLPLSLTIITSVDDGRERAFIRGALLAVMAVFMYIDISNTPSLVNFQWIFERE